MPPSTQDSAAGEITLNGGNAEVWAWERTVSGQVNDLSCETISVNVNEASVAARVEGDQFSATVPIAERENQITATCQPSEGQAVSSESVIYTGKLRRVPQSVIAISLEGDRIVLDGGGSQPAERDGTPIETYTWMARSSNPAPVLLEAPETLAGSPLEGDIQAQRLVLAPPSVDGEYFISLQVTDQEGHSDTSTTYFTVVNGQPVLADWDTENTAWVENTVVYGVIPRNFGSEGFQSIIDRLDYLAELGINALWLAPINQSPPGDYGYAVMDYFDVDQRYGDKEDFRRMVQEAHARGIRVLMDFVPNHSSERHPYFQDTLFSGQASPYWDFYDRDENGLPTHYFDWTHLPNLNYENPEVRRWMLEAFSYWVREYDVDGFRVDVAWGIRERRPDFWPEWRDTLKRIKPDLLLLAEASARDEFYFINGFDAAYDWTSQLGRWAWELVFEDTNLLTFNLNSALTNMRNGFHPDALIFRFMNNNDTGVRFVSKYGVDMTRVAAALLLTLPGIPCVFTGDEVGEQFQPYFDPAPLTWEDRHGLRDYYRRLITLRRETPSLHSRQWTILQVEPHQRVYGYLRFLADNSDPIVVLLNFFDEPAEVEVTLPEEFQTLATKSSFQDLLSGETISPSDGAPLRISMPPMRAMILS
jgi:glycosidase